MTIYQYNPPQTVEHGFVQTPFGVLVPPTSRVAAFVRSGGPVNGDSQFLIDRPIVTTLNAALAYARSGQGDIVYVLPDHAENISAADQMSNLVAGTQIVGIGSNRLRPTFTWTAATSTFLLDVDNVGIHNCILNFDPGTGITTVAAPITVSGSGCAITGCQIRASSSATSLCTIGITTTAAADHFRFCGNDVYGETAGTPTTFMQLVGADYLRMINNRIVCATSAAAVGPIRFLTTASTFIVIDGLVVRNNIAVSEQCVTGMAGISGEVDNIHLTVLSNAAAALTAAAGTGAFSTPANVTFGGNCYVSNLIGERGAQLLPVSA